MLNLGQKAQILPKFYKFSRKFYQSLSNVQTMMQRLIYSLYFYIEKKEKLRTFLFNVSTFSMYQHFQCINIFNVSTLDRDSPDLKRKVKMFG